MHVIRLFNDPAGKKFLKAQGIPDALVKRLDLLGISSAGNLAGVIKFSKYYELGERDILVTVLTDSMEMYGSRLEALTREGGAEITLYSKWVISWANRNRFTAVSRMMIF